jgi:hypothetical protein
VSTETISISTNGGPKLSANILSPTLNPAPVSKILILSILPLKTYSEYKRIIFNKIMVDKKDSSFLLLKQNTT